MEGNTNEGELHVVMFPWLAFGHLIPFLELSKSLAQKGNRVSFISTPRNLQRLPKIHPNLHHLITFIPISLPPTENLPEKAEATSDLPFERVPYLKKAYDGLAKPVSDFLENTHVDWIIHDFAPHWLPAITSKLGIPCIFLSIENASLNAYLGPPASLINDENSQKKPEDLTVPRKWIPFPNNLVFRTHEIKKLFSGGVIEANVSGVSDIFRYLTAVQNCKAVAIRTCPEYESEWLSLLEKNLFQKPILPIGLLPPVMDNGDENDEWAPIRDWLDKQECKSVVYIALGTEATLSQEETTELALGLELSKLPFFWVLRNPPGLTQKSVELPTGFEERTNGRGFIWRSWAPQFRILGHQSIGGFLTHSGWSSIIEGIGLGVPLILLPVINGQPLNARMLEWEGIGLEVERNGEDGLLTKEAVAKALKIVTVEEEGEIYREKVKELKELFGDKEKHDCYVDEFIRYMKENI